MTYSVTKDRSSDVLVVAIVMIVVSTLAVGLRCWSRYVAHKAEMWWDDWLSLLALVSLILFALSDEANHGVLSSIAIQLGYLWAQYVLGLSWPGSAHRLRPHS